MRELLPCLLACAVVFAPGSPTVPAGPGSAREPIAARMLAPSVAEGVVHTEAAAAGANIWRFPRPVPLGDAGGSAAVPYAAVLVAAMLVGVGWLRRRTGGCLALRGPPYLATA